MFREILVPLDGTYLAGRAVAYAVALAHVWKSRVALYHWSPPRTAARHAGAERQAMLQLEALASQCESTGLTVEMIVDHGAYDHLAAAIAEAVRERSVGLIVMATHGQGGVEDAFMGSSVERVVRGADVPVLVIPAEQDQPWERDRDLRVLVPLDGSELSEVALGTARTLLADFEGTLVLARAVDPDAERGDQDALTRGIAHARDYIARIGSAFADSGLRVQQVIEVGAPAVALEKAAASHDVDVIVIGTHARGGLERLVKGSVTGALLGRAARPVLVVPAPSLR